MSDFFALTATSGLSHSSTAIIAVVTPSLDELGRQVRTS